MAQATDPHKITCPICRKVTTLPHGDLTNLPPNFFMDNLKELITKETDGDEDEVKVTASAYREVVVCSLEDCQVEAVLYCTLEQEYMCQTCTDEHSAGRFSKKHRTITAAAAKSKMTLSTESHHPCGRHPDQMLDMYCKTCEEIICHKCCKAQHGDHNYTTLIPFVKPCEKRLATLLKRIDKLIKCVDLARQTSQQQIDKAQHHIVSLKTQVTSTFKQIREKLAQQEERLMSDIEKAAAGVDKVASSTEDEQRRAEVNLESLRFLGQSLLTGDVYDQMSNLPSLEEAVEKRWKTEIPGVVWMDESDQDEKKINMSDVDHLTLTEISRATSMLPCLEVGAGSDIVASLEGVTDRDSAPSPETDAANVIGAEFEKSDQQTSESGNVGEITNFSVDGKVVGICVYKYISCIVKLNDTALFMYNASGDLIEKHVLEGIQGTRGLVLIRKRDNDKLVITTRDPFSLCHLPISDAGGKCMIGNTQQQMLDFSPWSLCVDHNNNLVVADRDNGRLHMYNSSGDEINTIKLPSGVEPRYLSSDPSGGYIVTDESNQIIWIDEQGAQQRHHKDTTCGIAMSLPRGVVRDSENRYLVADRDCNQLLLFSKDGGDVRCLVKHKITEPYSIYLDQQQDKLYVGTWDGQVVVYDYYMLLGETRPIKYNLTRLGINV